MRLLTGKHRAEYEAGLMAMSRTASQAVELRVQAERLIDEVQFWRERCQAERARADRAVDELLSVRGFAPLTPPTMPPSLPDLLTEDASEVAEIESRLKAGDASVFAERR